MQIQDFEELLETAVSPVVGVILMVAVTVVLSAVIGVFVLDMGSTISAPSSAGVSVAENSADGTVTVQLLDGGTVDEVIVRTSDGDVTLTSTGQSVTVIAEERIAIIGSTDGTETVLRSVEPSEQTLANVILAPQDLEAVLEEMDGTGDPTDPYVIMTDHDLQAMAADLTGHYVLGQDIDATRTPRWNDGTGFTPVGDDTTAFTGSLDGNDYEITGLTINRPEERYMGLFGVMESGTVSHLTMTDTDVIASYYTGPISGKITNSDLSHVTITGGTVSDGPYKGGVVGLAYSSSIVETHSSAAVSTSNGKYAGGIAAWVSDSEIRQSSSSGTISSAGTAGGLVGYLYESSISESYSASQMVEGNMAPQRIGGLAGKMYNASIDNSYFTGDVTGSNYIGGIVGTVRGESTVTHAYMSGSVSATFSDSGFDFGTISESSTFNAIYVRNHWRGATAEETTELTIEEMTGEAAATNMAFDFETIYTTVPDDTPELR